MLRYIYADQLHTHPKLAASMFRDRADQFKTRLKWDVNVDAQGFERDEFVATKLKCPPLCKVEMSHLRCC